MIWKRTRQSHRQRQDRKQREIKQADLDMVELSAAVGEIDLFYLDESGFCMWTPVSYSYFFKGRQKRLEQTKRRGRRLSILGLWQPLVKFTYGLAIGSFTSESYIKMMDEQAKLAQSELKRTGKIRVIVQDNGSIHKSQKVIKREDEFVWFQLNLVLNIELETKLMSLGNGCTVVSPRELRDSIKERLQKAILNYNK